MRYPLTDRCAILRDRVVVRKEDARHAIGQRLYHYVAGYYDVPQEKRDNSILPAACLASVIRGFEPYISEGELIVGYNYCDGDPEEGAEEFLKKNVLKEGGSRLRSYLERGDLPKDRIDWLMHSLTQQGDPFRYPFSPTGFVSSAGPHDSELALEMSAMGICAAHNHSIVGYEEVLRCGFRGILERIGHARASLRKTDRNDHVMIELPEEQKKFYDALETVCEACCGIGRRYSELARMQAQNQHGARKKELLEIQQICERVPEYPALTFREALQSLWFAHVINTWEDGINANSLGRLDQILYPYYRKDIDAGLLTEENAFELICCLWLKLYRDYDVQQSTVGGCDREGIEAVNALSYLMLDATETLDFVRCLSVRFSQNTPPAFLRRALEVVGHVKKGIPFFFNDDVLIPSLTRRGIALEDARDYAMIGCVETCIPGKSHPHAVAARCNVLKGIEYALYNGRSMIRPELSPGVVTGGLDSYDSFESLKQAVFLQIDAMVDAACRMTNAQIPVAAHDYPMPYKSLLTEGCMRSGLDFNAGGPVYNYYQMMVLGIPNLADSLEAIDKLVFKEKRYTLEELVDQLVQDFPDEAVRLDFINKAPKFGNDSPEVDRLASEIMEHTCRYIETIPSSIGQGFHPQPFTFLWMVDHGSRTAATPDGRRSGEILAYSVSPMQGRDFNGFTALLNSISGLPNVLAPGTSSAIVEVDPYLFSDMNNFVELLLASAQRGLSNIQFNTIDRETLEDAKRHPERHRNLAVRVSGFSQRFCLLDEAMQDHIIKRTKHRLF